ncbi:MAG: hypothetical protein ABXS93_05170 [Sulfurimonas sp.]
MEILSVTTKKQIVLSRVIYDYIINGLADSLTTLSEQEMQLFVMRINMQAITHAIDLSQQEEIIDFDFSFDQLGVSFSTKVPLSQVKFSPEFIDNNINLLRNELGEDFEHMVTYLKKMEETV